MIVLITPLTSQFNTMYKPYKPSLLLDHPGVRQAKYPPEGSRNAFSVVKTPARDATSSSALSSLCTQDASDTSIPGPFDAHGIILPSCSPGGNLDGPATVYQFPKGTLGVGDYPTILSQKMFGADGLISSLHPGINPWPYEEVATRLDRLKALGPDFSALYVEVPIDHPDDLSRNSCSRTQGTLYVYDKDEGPIFTEEFTFEGSPVEAFSRLGTAKASRDGTTGTAVESEA